MSCTCTVLIIVSSGVLTEEIINQSINCNITIATVNSVSATSSTLPKLDATVVNGVSVKRNVKLYAKTIEHLTSCTRLCDVMVTHPLLVKTVEADVVDVVPATNQTQQLVEDILKL